MILFVQMFLDDPPQPPEVLNISHFGSAFAVLGIGGLLGSVLLIMEIAYNCIFDTMEK